MTLHAHKGIELDPVLRGTDGSHLVLHENQHILVRQTAWTSSSITCTQAASLLMAACTRSNEGRLTAPLTVTFASCGAYGVGSTYDPPKMSLLPNVAGQSCCGAGGVGSDASPTAVPLTMSWR
jgi:hypothetical protein